MIKSMTAFSQAETTTDNFTTIIEIRSYNSRYLDIALRVSRGYHLLEDRIKGMISAKVNRGRIEINVQIKDHLDETLAYDINTERAKAYHEVLMKLKDLCNIKTEVSLELLAAESGVIVQEELEKDVDACWVVVKECLAEAIEDLNNMRSREGKFIAADISKRLDYIEKSLTQINDSSGDLLIYYQKRLKERIASLTKGLVDIEPGRIAQEAAILADRSDIAEEIVRAESHIKQFRHITRSKESSGRKLNFLLQELNREFNTMGSKTEKAEISHIVVEVKSELEKIREQVQNVE
ncbi:MAG: YicC/YloC family endoribonuclease [Thermodesulfobacteriota bacterium]|nr:YicC/YloC family endoribonuclease [Thermodesulfobacteriota bacterium]